MVLVYKKVSGVRLPQKTAKLFDVECGSYLLKKTCAFGKISISNLNFASSQLYSPSTYMIYLLNE